MNKQSYIAGLASKLAEFIYGSDGSIIGQRSNGTDTYWTGGSGTKVQQDPAVDIPVQSDAVKAHFGATADQPTVDAQTANDNWKAKIEADRQRIDQNQQQLSDYEKSQNNIQQPRPEPVQPIVSQPQQLSDTYDTQDPQAWRELQSANTPGFDINKTSPAAQAIAKAHQSDFTYNRGSQYGENSTGFNKDRLSNLASESSGMLNNIYNHYGVDRSQAGKPGNGINQNWMSNNQRPAIKNPSWLPMKNMQTMKQPQTLGKPAVAKPPTPATTTKSTQPTG